PESLPGETRESAGRSPGRPPRVSPSHSVRFVVAQLVIEVAPAGARRAAFCRGAIAKPAKHQWCVNPPRDSGDALGHQRALAGSALLATPYCAASFPYEQGVARHVSIPVSRMD